MHAWPLTDCIVTVEIVYTLHAYCITIMLSVKLLHFLGSLTSIFLFLRGEAAGALWPKMRGRIIATSHTAADKYAYVL